MTERLDQLLADKATVLVQENFTGVAAEWWWERRMGGGIAVCQMFHPTAVAREIASRTGRDTDEVGRILEEELGLEDAEPVVLTFDIPGDTTVAETASLLAARSGSPEGLAANLYRRVEEMLYGR
ncbi:MAG: hypothetical protein AVDCRST_MAG37-684 [uncultured Rubrobacteraceae bacterium]|uniref:Uncharacterized protein n=1 Tax=uncultured Rubrobacteraceae bacterium TaxID=349277 RepID=A0A6J4Q4W5_9ACTN|nr:MAG: hypothetical protein AVDCRST_MAG37-684 [uncultured Rubrobacteraceae bacterium]